MRLGKALAELKLARSGAEAVRLIKQGAVYVGGCDVDCTFFTSGICNCGGWAKVVDPLVEIPSGTAIKIGNGNWRLMNSNVAGKQWDQVMGIGRVK